jgi:hypothetical protein
MDSSHWQGKTETDILIVSMHLTRRFVAQMIFFAGLAMMLIGTVFLISTITGISRFSLFWSCLFLIIGGLFAVLAIKVRKRSVYFFFAAFFILTGLFSLLSLLGIIPLRLAQGWPLLSVFAGIALALAGWRHFRDIRIRYLIPALAFTALGFVLLPFSLKLVAFSFKRFMINWWPLLLVLAGLVLVLLSLGTKPKNDN